MIKPLPNDKILEWSKLKVFADDKIYVTEKLKPVFRSQHFLLFPQCFQKASLIGSLKDVIVW